MTCQLSIQKAFLLRHLGACRAALLVRLLPSVTIHHYSINNYVCTVIVFVSVGLTASHTHFSLTDSDYPFGIFKLFLYL
jgi:hypothetical protein